MSGTRGGALRSHTVHTSEMSPPMARGDSRRVGARGRLSMVGCGRSALKGCRNSVTSVPICGGNCTRPFVADGARMSQDDEAEANRTMLDNLNSWSREVCRRELPSVLPRLLISLEDAEGRAASLIRAGAGGLWQGSNPRRLRGGGGGGSKDSGGCRA